MKIGYARVSAKWYQSEFQVTELEKQGCDKVWRESLIGDENSDKPLKEFLDQISAGDTVIATRVTAVAHSAADLLNLLEQIQKKGAFFRSLAEPWANTRVQGGERVIETIRGMIDFEIAVADMKTRSVQERPQTFGVLAGRPPKLTQPQKDKALSLLKIGKSAAEIGRMLGVSRSTISRMKGVGRSNDK